MKAIERMFLLDEDEEHNALNKKRLKDLYTYIEVVIKSNGYEALEYFSKQ